MDTLPPDFTYERALARSFARILRWAAAGPVLAGCASDHASDPGLPLSCEDGRWLPLVGFQPAETWDYVSVREPLYGGEETVRVLHETGEVCGGALDLPSCLLAVEATDRAPGVNGQRFIVATRADQVSAFATTAMAASFLGSVDNADEVLWLVQHYGDPCASSRSTDVTLKDDLFSVEIAEPLACDLGRKYGDSIYRYTVSVGGAVRELEGEMPSEPSCGSPVPGRRP